MEKTEYKCPLCEGEGCFDNYGEGFFIVGNELNASCEAGCCGIEPLTIKYCPLCGKDLDLICGKKRLKKETNDV